MQGKIIPRALLKFSERRDTVYLGVGKSISNFFERKVLSSGALFETHLVSRLWDAFSAMALCGGYCRGTFPERKREKRKSNFRTITHTERSEDSQEREE